MNQPIELVRPGDQSAPASPAPWPATNWWVIAPILLIGVAALLTLQLRWLRARRLSDSERAFRRLAALCRLPARHRMIVRDLAAAHASASPVAILLSPGAARDAAAELNPKPGTAQRRVLDEWLRQRGIT